MLEDMYDYLPEESAAKLRRRNKERLAELDATTPERQARIKEVQDLVDKKTDTGERESPGHPRI